MQFSDKPDKSSDRWVHLPNTRQSLQQIRHSWYSSSTQQPFFFGNLLPSWKTQAAARTIEQFCIDFVYTKNANH